MSTVPFRLLSRFNPHHNPDDVKNISPGDSVIDSIAYIFDVVKWMLSQIGNIKSFFINFQNITCKIFKIERTVLNPKIFRNESC